MQYRTIEQMCSDAHSITLMPGGPKWCELFLKLYRTPYSTELTVTKTDIVTVCLKPVTVATHLVVLTVLEYSCVVIFARKMAHRNQQLQRATILKTLSCQLMYYAKFLLQLVYTKNGYMCVRYNIQYYAPGIAK